ncbi:ExeA family protein [Halothiobacillus diazotrophicus]|uniref:ExeA family protein n=1 Tax=Halothiobacillus diazotrophicus TaxID=1860122 RepID=UPI000ACF97E1|nr:AAA family ATPase [Halothiobacillus diazotrophicus]
MNASHNANDSPIQLKAVLVAHGLSQQALAVDLGISRSAITALCSKGLWPKKNREALRERITAFLVSHGVGAATLTTVFNPAASSTEATAEFTHPKEDRDMLLRKQPLFPATKKHFQIFADPFGELQTSEEVFTSPDVRYVRAALAQTLTSERFIAIVGESGAGKSTLRRDFIDRISRESLPVVVIEPYVLGLEENDQKGKSLKSTDIAAAIIRTLDPKAGIRISAEARFAQLHRLLRDSRRAGMRHVLIIEEAHGLSIPTLKHLKRFYELEDGFSRLLSIVLIGQPELAQKLAENRPDVREVVQRIETITLDPLDGHLDEYLSHRLERAGKAIDDVIDPTGIEALRSKLTVPGRTRGSTATSLLYPLAVGNQLTAAMNLAAELGAPIITADIVRSV